MKKLLKRYVAMLLFAVMIFGILPIQPGTVFAANEVTPTEATSNLMTEAEHNYNFQVPLSSDPTKPMGWTEFYKRNWSSYEIVQRASGDAALKYTVTNEGLLSGATGTNGINAIYSEPISVESYVGQSLMVNADAKIVSGTPGLQVFLCFFTNTDKPAAIASSGVSIVGSFNLGKMATKEWSTVSSSQVNVGRTVAVPEGAKYARIFLYFSCKSVGEICVDNVVVKNVCADDTHTYNEGNVSTAIYKDDVCETRYYKRCDKCDYLPYLTQVGVDGATVVGKFKHSLTAVPHKAATETETGNVAYWTCGGCGKWFADADATVVIEDHNDVIIGKRYKNLMEDADPSFENTEVGQDPASWTQFSDTKNFFEVSDAYASTGSKSLKLFTDETSRIPTGIYGPVISIADMEAVSLIVDTYGDSTVSVYLYFYDAAMQQLSLGEGVRDWFEIVPRDKWQTFYRKYTVPEGARYLQVLFYKTNRVHGSVYFDDLIIKEFEKSDEPEKAAQLIDSFEEGSAPDGLPWGWTTVTEASKNTADMKYFEIVDLTSEDKPAGAPEALNGTHALKFTQVAEDGLVRGIFSPYIDVSAMQAVLASVDIMGPSSLQIYIMFYDEDYNCPQNTDWRPWTIDESFDEWGQMNFEVAVPQGAKYAQLCLYKASRSYYDGVIYIDRIVLKETKLMDSSQVLPEIPEYVDYEWTILETEHPRLYFNAEELRRIKRTTTNDTLNSMGYTGSSAYAELLAEADGYLAETSFIKHYGGVSGEARKIVIQLYPKLEDISIDERFHEPPNAAFSGTYPYFSTLSGEILQRMKSLALAYALSGEQKYADRAIQYAVDMCNWEYWEGDLMWQDSMTQYGEFSNQGIGYCIRAVSTVYDICYHLLTENQKKLMEEALIENLEHVYNDTLSRMKRGRDFDVAITAFYGACAIMNKSNKEQVVKYLDRAMQYTQWIFDWYEKGHNEGYSYAHETMEQMFDALAICERVTGKAGMLDHPFAAVTLPNWIKGFMEPQNGTMPGYRDSDYHVTYFPIVLSTLAKRGDTAAGFCLHRTGGGNTPFEKLVYTNISDAYIWPPDDDYMNVTVLEQMGIGALRTGWGELDKLMMLYSDDYPYHHTHWENNSIYFALDGEWLIRDPGYGSITTGAPKTDYDMKYAVNSIYVDNKPQSVKDVGDISEIFNTELYGQVRGSAPDAFGKYNDESVLSRFDRDVIMFNHDSASYYVVIDDLASSQERTYGWNMVFTGWERFELDNEEWDHTQEKEANHFAMLKNGKVLHQYFVGESLTFFSTYFTKAGESYGPLFRANTKTTVKSKQFMTVINAEAEYDGVTAIDSTPLQNVRSTKTSQENPDGFSWFSSHTYGQGIARPLGPDGYKATMFRADQVGDWMSYPFYVEEGGTFLVSLKIGHFQEYGGTWQIYLDGELVAENVAPRSLTSRFIPISFGKREITEGKHMIKVVLVGDTNPQGEEWGTLISMGEILLKKEGASLGNGSVEVLESYDTDKLIGATIRYGTVLNDVILSNKGTDAISAGNVSTNGKQAAILGLYEGEIKEGYSLLNGTSLKYGETTLVTADTAMDVTVDFRLSRYPVKNTDDDEELELDEDFSFKNPKTLLNVSTEKAGTLSIYVGTDAPFTVTVNGQTVEAAYADGMLTVSVWEGTQNLEIIGTHHCVFDQRLTGLGNVKTWADCFNANEYYMSCLCGKNGEETFLEGAPKGHRIVAVKAQDPTETEEGCIAHFSCKNCDKLFADAEGKMELLRSDVVISKLIPAAPEANGWMIWLAVGGVILLGAAAVLVVLLKKKAKK
ncbi:MAG: DUF4962 domain-containing protein [Ruminococcaceae bacterium]|nr:DUF4962 domain-containing protein [Oscillospiraceae bacterium]